MIKIYSYSKEKVNIVQETSNLDSNFSESANILDRKRRRKRPVRYEQSSDDSLSESESLMKKRKQYKIPSSPTATTVSQVKNNSSVQVIKEMEDIVSGSESSYEKEPNATPKSQTAVFIQLIKHMKLMHDELRELNAKSESMNSKVMRLINKTGENIMPQDWCLPSGIDLPADTDEALQQLNENLKNDKELSEALVRYLSNSISGRTVSSFVLNVTKKLLSQEVALMYSRYGRKGKKSFSNLRETLKVILDATALKFKDISKEDILDVFGKALGGASDWNGRKIRPSDYLPNSSYFNKFLI